jgi:hypothetical protein
VKKGVVGRLGEGHESEWREGYMDPIEECQCRKDLLALPSFV